MVWIHLAENCHHLRPDSTGCNGSSGPMKYERFIDKLFDYYRLIKENSSFMALINQLGISGFL
jgi:hypothetical protein